MIWKWQTAGNKSFIKQKSTYQSWKKQITYTRLLKWPLRDKNEPVFKTDTKFGRKRKLEQADLVEKIESIC